MIKLKKILSEQFNVTPSSSTAVGNIIRKPFVPPAIEPTNIDKTAKASAARKEIGKKVLTSPSAISKDLAFKIPTGNWTIRNDEGGKGHYLARRAGGRKHLGIDLKTNVGQQIIAPIDGIVKKTKANSTAKLDGTRIKGTGKYKGYTVYMFYTKPFSIGSEVKQGDVVSTQLPLQRSKGGDYSEDVTDHVHIRVDYKGKMLNPTAKNGQLNWIV
jgi:murein DD-endopeptidase MepM/ murein hydrolase activator NlpD